MAVVAFRELRVKMHVLKFIYIFVHEITHGPCALQSSKDINTVTLKSSNGRSYLTLMVHSGKISPSTITTIKAKVGLSRRQHHEYKESQRGPCLPLTPAQKYQVGICKSSMKLELLILFDIMLRTFRLFCSKKP